jgi:hypothetical protein
VADAAAEAFGFRRLDLVAVKGKTRGVRVLELLDGVHVAEEK